MTEHEQLIEDCEHREEKLSIAAPASPEPERMAAAAEARSRAIDASGQAEPNPEYQYALNLAMAIYRAEYASKAPDWEPLPDLLGLLTQIDNMVAGLLNLPWQAEAPVAVAQPVAQADTERLEWFLRSRSDMPATIEAWRKAVDAARSQGGQIWETLGAIGRSDPKAWEAVKGAEPAAEAHAADLAKRAAPPPAAGVGALMHKTELGIGSWLSAALEDDKVCAEMKADIRAWMQWTEDRGAPLPAAGAPDAREALAGLVRAIQLEMSTEWDCNSYHPALYPTLETARKVLADKGQS